MTDVRRLRWLFVALGVLLALPLALLLRRALVAVAVEREARHRTVAERILDEMERELGALVAREEARPEAHYRFLSDAATAERSPLSQPPLEPWLIGYFELDGTGRFSSPLRPAEPGALPGWRPASDPDRTLAALERIVQQGLGARAARADLAPPREAVQAPGTTRKLAQRKNRPEAASEVDDVTLQDTPAPEGDLSAYDALRSLNRGVQARLERQALGASEGRDAATGASPSAPALAAEAREQAASQREAFAKARGAADADASVLRSVDEAPAAGPDVEPLRGRAVGVDHLILFRSLARRGGTLRQGLVVHVPSLARALAERVLGDSALASHAQLAFFTLGTPPPPTPAGDPYTWQHRFAEPFDALAARLTLAPLPDVAGAGTLMLLAALLVVVAGTGLFALYRMVAVTVRFAERRSNFVAAVTHELKTPLTAIRMYGEMLRDGLVASEDRRREYYARITAESERLTRLIDGVLEFSQLGQGTRALQLRAGPPAPVVEEAARILEPHVAQHGFELRLELPDALPEACFDRDALLQVLFNLVDNALKYARDAEQRVVVLACRSAPGGVVLSVRDHGCGVAARHLPHIFEAFYRGEDELTRRARGTGIGLALVRGLAERMGAAVSGRNAEGGGFEVSLLLRAANA